MAKFNPFLVIICLIFSSSNRSNAGEHLQKISFYATSSYPWGYIENGKYKGIMVDWAKLIFSEANISVEITLASPIRIIKDLESGKAEASIQIFSPTLDKVSFFVAKTPSQISGTLSLKGNVISSISQLYNKDVCLLRGGSYGKKIDNEQQIRKYTLASYEQIVKMVVLGRCFVGIGLIKTLNQSARSLGYTNERFAKSLIIQDNLGGLVLSKKYKIDGVLTKLKRATDSLSKQGVFEQIANSYIEQDKSYLVVSRFDVQ